MPDISHTMGSDLNLSSSGDFLVVTGIQEGNERVLRRLLTNAGDYIWHLDYGAGLRQMVGQITNVAAIENTINTQILQEPAVAQIPAPNIQTSKDAAGNATTSIIYTDAPSGQSTSVVATLGS